VQAGEIGRVLFARGWINSTRPSIGQGKPVSVPDHLNFDLWQGPALERPYVDNLVHYNWHWFWNWGTGELGNNGIHALDLCRWGLGVDYPQKITCGGGRLHFNDDQETPDTQIATFHFKDAAGEEKVINWEHRTWNRRGFEGDAFGVVFYGEAGSLVLSGREMAIYDLENKEVHRGGASYSNQEHIANFLETIRGNGTLNAEIEEGVKSTALCHLGNIAYRSGQTVTFDPATQQVQGDSSVSALWGREYRAGWEPKV
jgi:predicted dehydrogenase